MKLMIFLPIIFILFLTPTFAQNEPQRYSYNVLGIVLDEKSRPMPNILVCFYPSERPINGRIPCVKTNYEGRFSVGEKTIPDKYIVCASTVDYRYQPEQANDRDICSKPMVFGAKDESKKVKLKFKAKGNEY